MKQSIKRNTIIIFLIFIFSGMLNPAEVFPAGKKKSHYINARTPENLREIFRYDGQGICFLSAHRGGPEKHLPENCIVTFANTLKHTYAIMEIDPRYTKDSVIIVHHDYTLQRTTTGEGKVSDFTFNELRKLRLKDMEGNATRHKIPTLDELFKWAKGKTILVLDKKDVPIEERVKAVEKNRAEAWTIVMAYSFEEAQKCHALNKNIMMQVFINTPQKVDEFDKIGVPWENVVVFVGHQMPDNLAVFEKIHQKGARCIVGTSRNIDREFIEQRIENQQMWTNQYNDLYNKGVDILETDIPVPVSEAVVEKLRSNARQLRFQK